MITLVIATYNWPEALKLCLDSLRHQTLMPREVIIADDGSTETTKSLIETFINSSGIDVRHIWHSDRGFRLSQIRNRAIAEARGEYIVQIDGDILMHPRFLEDHRRIMKRGYFVAGSRVMLSQSATNKLLKNRRELSRFRLLWSSGLSLNSLRIAFMMLALKKRYKVSGRYSLYIKGCNMAFFKQDFLSVNGYNEDIEGWGFEDVDLANRLLHSGIEKMFIKFGAIAYHLWHTPASRERLNDNYKIMKECILTGGLYVPNGIDKYLN